MDTAKKPCYLFLFCFVLFLFCVFCYSYLHLPVFKVRIFINDYKFRISVIFLGVDILNRIDCSKMAPRWRE